MNPYVNATIVREAVVPAADGGETVLRWLEGEAGDAGRQCIHRVQSDLSGRLKSDIVYFYDASVKTADVEADFALLQRGGLMSVSQLHHVESMLNRGQKMSRR